MGKAGELAGRSTVTLRDMYQLPFFWYTQLEIKSLLRKKQDEDKEAAMGGIAKNENVESTCGRVFGGWDPNRYKTRKTAGKLSYDSNFVGAAGFKILKGRKLGKVACPECGEKDSRIHCQSRYWAHVPEEGMGNKWLGEIDRAVNIICAKDPDVNKLFDASGIDKRGRKTQE